jgi:SAM-dependent methyltransferase
MHTHLDAYERSMWEGRAQAYVLSFATLCAYPIYALLDAAGVADGTLTLDVGTGPGTAARAATARGAHVTAVDAEPSMIEVASAAVPSANVGLAMLPELPFADGAFDAVVANFVVNHVGDPAAAVAELRRVVRPGGRVAATVWPRPSPPLQLFWADVAAAAGLTSGPTVHSAPRVAPEADFARTPVGFAELLSGAGLRDVACETIDWQHETTIDACWSAPANGLGALGAALRGASPTKIDEVRRTFERLAAAHVVDGVLRMPTAALLASGTR